MARSATVAATRSSRPRNEAVVKTTAARRAERQEATRRKILDAAARVIGRYGYSGCSVARVTTKARIAHGTFYLYFKSQQQLFDLILPTLGGEMIESIALAIGDETDPLEIERRGFSANVAYMIEHPYMNRVLYEAQLFAPKVYAKYIERIVESYVRSFQRTLKRGRFAGAREDELRRVATMMVSARTSLLLQLGTKTINVSGFVDGMVETYLKFVRGGLDI